MLDRLQVDFTVFIILVIQDSVASVFDRILYL